MVTRLSGQYRQLLHAAIEVGGGRPIPLPPSLRGKGDEVVGGCTPNRALPPRSARKRPNAKRLLGGGASGGCAPTKIRTPPAPGIT